MKRRFCKPCRNIRHRTYMQIFSQSLRNKLKPNQTRTESNKLPNAQVDQSLSSPSVPQVKSEPNKKKTLSPRGITSSESDLFAAKYLEKPVGNQTGHLRNSSAAKGDERSCRKKSSEMLNLSPDGFKGHSSIRDQRASSCVDSTPSSRHSLYCQSDKGRIDELYKSGSRSESIHKNSSQGSPILRNDDQNVSKQIREIHYETRKSARVIRDSKLRLMDIQGRQNLSERDIKELCDRNELLLREMDKFDLLTKKIQKLVITDARALSLIGSTRPKITSAHHIPETPISNEMNHLAVLLAKANPNEMPTVIATNDIAARSKSEIDLTRKLNESYDMQEKLVADNADLEVKRYILYKELITKDQKLETCRAQIKRLQAELKLMNKENSLLQDRLQKNNPKGDASSIKTLSEKEVETLTKVNSDGQTQELNEKLEHYKQLTCDLEQQLGDLESELRSVKAKMAEKENINRDVFKTNMVPPPGKQCRSGAHANCCYRTPDGPAPPPMTKACGVCPPCQAPCNPDAPPTPAEKEVAKLSVMLRQTEENFKTKIAECAVLRAELCKKKEELEKERCQHREAKNKLRELEMRFEGLTNHTNMMLGTKEHAFETEVNVKALKQCYREARDEIEELRSVLKEQGDQLQEYRVKYLQAQQTVEEQKRQLDLMDMDNTRISEQINLEIQKVKLKFQEKLQELAPIPDLLKSTQARLRDAQQSQALAEHNAEQLARELSAAREKVHFLLHTTPKAAPEKSSLDKNDEKVVLILQQRITQLTELNATQKTEIERLKNNVIRLEEAVLANERRLQEKMHECASLGGELDKVRDEAARAIQRAVERTETTKKCMQTTVAELERQLALSRAQVSSAEKEREEIQRRMKCQITRLTENFEQAQLRILGLQAHVMRLRRTASGSSITGDGDNDNQECACKTFFDNP